MVINVSVQHNGVDIVSPEGGRSEGLDAFRFFFNSFINTRNTHTHSYNIVTLLVQLLQTAEQ